MWKGESMDLSELKDKIQAAFTGSEYELNRILGIVEEDESIFPFNEYEHLICNIINVGGLTFQSYMDIRTEYVSLNPNLWIFEISAPRGFGEKFAQTYVQGKCPDLRKANKSLDPDFSGEYDLFLEGIKIEVKASRAVDSSSDEPLYIKALSRSTDKPFLMNFQQLKSQCCDVFVWVAVFRDEIVLWVMSSNEVRNNPLFSKGQHRGNAGNEGQLHVNQDNVHLLAGFELGRKDLGEAIRKAYERQNA